jgi:hypothetical protein
MGTLELYIRQGSIDRTLRRMECAAKGHRWWHVLSLRVCGNCGKTEL